jgi:hypothetical protein
VEQVEQAVVEQAVHLNQVLLYVVQQVRLTLVVAVALAEEKLVLNLMQIHLVETAVQV